MGKIIFITGGARSGKSNWAQSHAESLPGPHFYLATAPVLDKEMATRIQRHQEHRKNFNWQTIEEQIDLARSINQCNSGTILIDCLTLWVNNLMYQAEQKNIILKEDEIAESATQVIEAIKAFDGTCIFVSNETGLGVVPENPMARNFRDLAGRCNQIFAEAANEAWLMVSGISLKLK